MSSSKTKVLTFGVFDPFHKGHEDLFRQAKEQGDWLIVVVARDSWIKVDKKREPLVTEDERLAVVKKQKLVDEVRFGYEWPPPDKYGLLRELDFDVVALGYDQSVTKKEVKKELWKRGKEGVKVKRMRPFKPAVYKSSFFRE